ncbi:uncharacterized protein LOC106180853 [Lingula anatina]|uniref:Uncharacterized protein LOC106180853 n=1 Tax=Lingula anatina TaxID=7574 RepID=A0A1S3KCU9_LINAN|nr:uncharacterized protein LOC106180853 [Lingula anatina]|eukprot:XP_013420465.1 uncharacterized protein LOC106180853 [Lingula anatina]
MAAFLAKSLSQRCSLVLQREKLLHCYHFCVTRSSSAWQKTLPESFSKQKFDSCTIRRHVSQQGRRKRMSEYDRPTFKVENDALLYTSDPSTKRLSRGATLAFAVGALSFFDLAYGLLYPVNHPDDFKEVEIKDTFLNRTAKKVAKYEKYLVGIFIACGFICSIVSFNLSRKVVHMIILKSGGEYVELYTSTLFGRLRKTEILLENMAGVKHRVGSGRLLRLRVRGRRYPVYMLDGKYHEPELFDNLVNVHRLF